MAKKITTTIRINDHIRRKLREQADKVGMDVSNYIAHLVIEKEKRDEQERLKNALMEEFLKAKVL